jgi:outer membrane murein-binding lipoprotein Lpp
MKWLLWMAAIAAALWAGSQWLEGGIERGREATAEVIADPVYDLAASIDRTRDTVEQANHRIDAAGTEALGVVPGAGNSASAFAANARSDLQAAGKR